MEVTRIKEVWNILLVVITIIRIITDSRTQFIKLNRIETRFFCLLLCIAASERPGATLFCFFVNMYINEAV